MSSPDVDIQFKVTEAKYVNRAEERKGQGVEVSCDFLVISGEQVAAKGAFANVTLIDDTKNYEHYEHYEHCVEGVDSDFWEYESPSKFRHEAEAQEEGQLKPGKAKRVFSIKIYLRYTGGYGQRVLMFKLLSGCNDGKTHKWEISLSSEEVTPIVNDFGDIPDSHIENSFDNKTDDQVKKEGIELIQKLFDKSTSKIS